MDYDYDFEVEDLHPQKVIAIRASTTTSGIPQVMAEAYGELYGYIAQRGIAPAGPPTAVYSRVADDGAIEVEICVPVPSAVDAAGRIETDELPATMAVTTTHRGPYEELPEAYEAIEEYARSRGFEPAGPMREEYLNGPPDTPPERYETRIEWPVRKAA